MESLSDDVLGLVLERVSNGEDRKSCSEVSTLWFTIEALTRACVCVHDPQHLPYLLPRFPNLTTLWVHTAISDEDLMFVAECCPNLRTLNLDLLSYSEAADDFGDEGLEAVARGCCHLVEVSLLHRSIGDDGILALRKYAKGLAVLDLSFCVWITDISLAVIAGMDSMIELRFRGCPHITDRGLKKLSSGPASRSLRVLTVSGCNITDVGIFYLRRMSCLEELDLTVCGVITDVGGVALSALSALKKLNLTGLSNVSDKTLFAVAKGCCNLVEIDLNGCKGITGRGVVSLASSLPLERIYMSRLKGIRGRRVVSDHVMEILERCRSLKLLIVDRELEEGLSLSQREKLNGLCRVEWY